MPFQATQPQRIMPETLRSRFRSAMAGCLPEDRLPVLEWAMWWHLTINRWHDEGLPRDLNTQQIKSFFNLDVDHQLWFPQFAQSAPEPKYPEAYIQTEADYEALLPHLYPREIPIDANHWRSLAPLHASGQILFWFTFSGFFWWPRVLFGIEPHLYAFYDEPQLMHRINHDQTQYLLRCLDAIAPILSADFMTFAEDMSYNKGPMISRAQFDEFLAPYYRQITPHLKQLNIIPLIDSDGDVEPLIPWFQSAGLEGILPLERMAGVDVNRIRRNHPGWKMIGGFDKTVMHKGEAAMRAEFERLLPVMRSGYFLPSVDHQTPPAVSIDQYRLYVSLLHEYAAQACKK
jgi:hypothetical protein